MDPSKCSLTLLRNQPISHASSVMFSTQNHHLTCFGRSPRLKQKEYVDQISTRWMLACIYSISLLAPGPATQFSHRSRLIDFYVYIINMKNAYHDKNQNSVEISHRDHQRLLRSRCVVGGVHVSFIKAGTRIAAGVFTVAPMNVYIIVILSHQL